MQAARRHALCAVVWHEQRPLPLAGITTKEATHERTGQVGHGRQAGQFQQRVEEETTGCVGGQEGGVICGIGLENTETVGYPPVVALCRGGLVQRKVPGTLPGTLSVKVSWQLMAHEG